MSNVLVRDRKTSEVEFLNTAINIKIEVTRMVMNEKIVPKRYRYIYSVPIVDKCRKLVDNGYVYDNCRNQIDEHGNDANFIYYRRKDALLGMLDACKQILSELACAKRQFNFKINPYERIIGIIVDEEGLIKRELNIITKKHYKAS